MLPSSVSLLLLEVNLKIKAFLYKDKKERTIMTKEELATILNGKQYGTIPTRKEVSLAKENNLIIVYGASDDLCEFAGTIEDEFDCYDGGEIECEDLPSTIEAIWGEKDGEPSWSYKTDMPHAEFNIYDGDELYCIGMVIDLNEVEKTNMKQSCHMCFNARVDPDGELTDDNDFSSCAIGDFYDGYRAMLSAGYGKPVRIEFEGWNKDVERWVPLGHYYPKFCPNCGRSLMEYE